MARSVLPRRAALALVSVVAGTSAAPGAAAAQDEQAVLTAQVRAAEIAFAQTMADRDLEAFLAFLSSEAVFFAGERPLRGRDAIEEAWASAFEGPTPPFSWHPDQVVVLASGDLAFSTGPVRSPEGEVVGRFNSVWRLDPDGRWRVVFDKGS